MLADTVVFFRRGLYPYDLMVHFACAWVLKESRPREARPEDSILRDAPCKHGFRIRDPGLPGAAISITFGTLGMSFSRFLHGLKAALFFY